MTTLFYESCHMFAFGMPTGAKYELFCLGWWVCGGCADDIITFSRGCCFLHICYAVNDIYRKQFFDYPCNIFVGDSIL